jgi:uncharacterized protein YprB with RNaseH-like and TPR domain
VPSVRSAYLDIETTGLSPYDSELTVVGLCVEQERRHRVVQFVGDDIAEQALWNVLDGIGRIYTYMVGVSTCRSSRPGSGLTSPPQFIITT